MYYRELAIVKAARIPSRMLATTSFMKILVFGTIKKTQPLSFIAHRVRMNQIQDNPNSQAMCGIDEFLELLRSPKA